MVPSSPFPGLRQVGEGGGNGEAHPMQPDFVGVDRPAGKSEIPKFVCYCRRSLGCEDELVTDLSFHGDAPVQMSVVPLRAFSVVIALNTKSKRL